MNGASLDRAFDGDGPLRPAGRMRLRSSLTSPFGRKVRIAALVLGLPAPLEIIHADTRDEHDELRADNPLGKIPCLLLDDGTALYDSRVILEYLDELSGGGRLLPAGGLGRYRALTRATLADGIADAALLMIYERRFREPVQVSETWLVHQRGKVERGLNGMAADLPDPETTDIVAISLACSLGYLDWRRPVDWRPQWPEIVQWLEAFAAAEPAFAQTAAPETEER